MDRFVRIGDAAQQLGVSVDTMRRWAQGGLISAYRSPGGQVKFLQRDVRELLSRREEPRRATRLTDASEPLLPINTLGAPKSAIPTKWTDLPPWEQRRAEAETEVAIERLTAVREQERVEEERMAREEDARASENARLTALKQLGRASCWIAEANAEVVRELERYVTSEQFPAWLPKWDAAMMIQRFVWSICERVREATQTVARKP